MRRFRNYIILFFLILIPLTALNIFWKGIDFAIYKKVYLNGLDENIIRPDIAIVDIPRSINKKFDREDYRRRLADLLYKIDDLAHEPNNKPKAVILDIWFSQDPLGDDLKKALLQLKKDEVNVYGVFDMVNYKKADSFEIRKGKMNTFLYDSILEGSYLHNIFFERYGVLDYSSLLYLKKEDGNLETIISLPFKVAKDYDENNIDPSDFANNKKFILPLGNQDSLVELTYQFTDSISNSLKPFDSFKNLKDKHIIIGSIDDDLIKIADVNQTGPYLLAWALNDQLKKEPIAKIPLNSMIFMLAMELFFSFLVIGIFALLFKFAKRLQTKPWVISILSFLTGIFLLGVFGALMFLLNYVIPVGLSLVGMLLASYLARHFCNKFLITRFAEGSGEHDVFISYSHSQKDFVKEHIYKPLLEFTKSNGKKLDIYFDEKNIRLGEAFTSDYMWGIVDSKHFVPIISEDYYGKPHCKNELDLAYFRTLENPPLIKIHPIALRMEYVPEIYKPRLTNVVEDNKNFIQDLLKVLDDDKTV